MGSVIIFCHTFYGNVNYFEIREEALKADETLSYFFDEPSLLVVNLNSIKVYLTLALLGIYGLVFFAIIVGYYFIKILRLLNYKQRSFTSFKTTRMIFISNVVQFTVTVVYLVIPFTIFFMLSIFDIPYSGPIVMVALTFCSFHCILEFSASFYFILPYRKFIKKRIILWVKRRPISNIIC